MLRQRKSLPFLDGLRVWLAVALLAISATFLYTNLASAQTEFDGTKARCACLARRDRRGPR